MLKNGQICLKLPFLENLVPSCGRPPNLDTSYPKCHTFFYPSLRLTADFIYGQPLNIHFQDYQVSIKILRPNFPQNLFVNQDSKLNFQQ